jgi:hypothetical protein
LENGGSLKTATLLEYSIKLKKIVLKTNQGSNMTISDLCYICGEKAEFNQPHKDTGVIISVCKKHFTMAGAS